MHNLAELLMGLNSLVYRVPVLPLNIRLGRKRSVKTPPILITALKSFIVHAGGITDK
jgi:hypothetical protein